VTPDPAPLGPGVSPKANANQPVTTPEPDASQQATTPEVDRTDPYVGQAHEAALAVPNGSGPVGNKIGSYEVLGELGRGGMGVVYKARQPALNRLVALKMIRSANLAGEEELARFRAEAQSAARLQHPNIVTLYEIGEQDGMPYFSLEFVEGTNLSQYLGGEPQPAGEAAALVEVLARAMHYAHARQIIHRDLKPANVLLQGLYREDKKATPRRDRTRDSRPTGESQTNRSVPGRNDWSRIAKITDFGLAKQLDDDQGQTVTGQVMGTPSYMAPEQAAGRVHEMGPLADVYALGAILYKCLTGRAPFQGASTRETLHQVLNVDPVPPNRLVPTIPIDLNTITLKCLEKDPARRYGSAQELADDLQRYLNGEPIVARPLGVLGRGLKSAKRNPVVAGLSSLALSLFLVGSILVTALWLRAEHQADNARKESIRANQQRDLATKERELAEEQRRLARMERDKATEAQKKEAQQRLRAEREAQQASYQKMVAERSAEAAKKAQAQAEQEEARAKAEESKAKAAQATAALAQQQAERSERETRRALAANLLTRAFEAWKQTNQRAACELLDGVPPDLRHWEWHYLRRLMLGGHTQLHGLGGWLAFHPNGTHVAGFIRPGQFALVDLRQIDKPILLQGEVALDLRARFSPDGQMLLAGGPKGLLRWEFPTGKLLPAVEDANFPVQQVAFASDGKSYAAAGPLGVRLWSAEGKKLHHWEVQAARSLALEFDRESQLLVWLGGSANPLQGGQLRIWETSSGQARAWPQEQKQRYYSLALHPQRDELFLVGTETYQLVAPRTGKPAGPDLAVQSSARGIVQVTPDGQYWALRDADGLTFLTADSGQTAFRIPLALQAGSYSFTADGQYVVVCPQEQPLCANFWSIKPRPEARWLQLAGHGPRHLSFSPDSRYLLTAGKGQALVWELSSGKLIRTLAPARVAAWSPDGRWIATGNYDEDGDAEFNLRLYEAATGQLVWRNKELPGTALAFSPDSKQLLVGSRVDVARRQGKVTLLQVEQGKAVWSVASGLVREIALNPQKDTVWTLESETPHVARYDRKTGNRLPSLALHEGQTHGWSIAATQELWLSFGAANRKQISDEIAVRDQNNRSLFLLSGLRSVVYSADWHPSQTRIVSSDETGNVQLWDRFTTQQLLNLQAGFAQPFKRDPHLQPVVVRFSPDGHYLVVGSAQGVQIYDGRPVPELAQMKADQGHRTSWLVSEPQQKWYLGRGPGPRIECRSAEGKLLWQSASSSLTPTTSCAYHLDRRRLALGMGYNLAEIEVPSGKTLRQYDARPHLAGPIYALAYSSDGKRLGCVSGGQWTILKSQATVSIWDVETGKLLSHVVLEKFTVNNERPWFSHDLSQIALKNAQPLTNEVVGYRLWDTATGQALPPARTAALQSELTWNGDNTRITNLAEGLTRNLLRDQRHHLIRLPDQQEQRHLAARLTYADSWHASEARQAYDNQQWYKAQFHLERAARLQNEDPDIIYNLASTIFNLAKKMGEEYRHEMARPHLERCLGIYEQLVRRSPKDANYIRDYANTLMTYSNVLEELGYEKEALKHAQRGLELSQQAHRLDPRAEKEADLVLAYNGLACTYKGALDEARAKKVFADGVEYGEQALKRHRDHPSIRYSLASVYHNRASLYSSTQEHELALTSFQRSIDLLTPLIDINPSANLIHDLANSYIDLAGHHVLGDEPAKATQAITQALELLRSGLKAEPNGAFLGRHYAEVLSLAASLYARMGKLAEADAAYEEALELTRSRLRQDPKQAISRYDLSAILHNHAKFLLLYLDRPLTAELQYRKAEQLLEELVESYPRVRHYRRDLANTRVHLAETLLQQEKRLPALSAFQRAYKSWQAFAKDYPNWQENGFQMLSCRAMIALLQNRRDEVIRLAAEMTQGEDPRKRSGYEAAVVLIQLAQRSEDKVEREKLLAQAVNYLQQSLKDRDESKANLRRDPQLKLLYERKDFQDLFAPVGKEKELPGIVKPGELPD